MENANIPRRAGKHKCPECSHKRKNKTDKPMSVHYDAGVLYYRCHHCDYKGRVESDYTPARRSYRIPEFRQQVEPPPDKMLEWFKKRGISAETVRRNQIERRVVYMPQSERDEPTIAFPYFRNGQIVNVKYRTANKDFKLESGAELILYGMDDIDSEGVIFVEGELDRLSLQEAGLFSCVSVPNGAGTNLEILESAEAQLTTCKKFIIAGDNDEKGIELTQKLITRLGPDRCWRVEWPEDCKDANDVLVNHGPKILAECIAEARPVPIEGAFGLDELVFDLVDLYNNGRPQGVHCGWDNLAQHYKPRLGQWTVITGTPNSGKSSFCRALLVNLALQHDWQFVVYPPEDCPPAEYWSLLLEIYTGKRFDPGYGPRMGIEEALEASQWVDKHFVIVNPKEGHRDLDSILEAMKPYVLRRGVNGFVIDPWNRVEHSQPEGLSVTQYIEKCLVRWSALTKAHNLHNIIVAHPQKPQRDKDGQYRLPSLYDISDSAHWHNMSDFGLVVWRDKEDMAAPVQVHVQKVRSRWCGSLGTAELYFDNVTGRYSEVANTWRLKGRADNPVDDNQYDREELY